MKNLGIKKRNKLPIILTVIFLIILSISLGYAFFMRTLGALNDFFTTRELITHNIVEVKFNKPIEIRDKEIKVVTEKIVLDYPGEIDTPIKKFICDTWGVYECKTALGVAQAESGIREEAFNINTNNTIDVGVFQINSIHFKKEGCSLKEIVNAQKNVLCAKQIWDSSGWGAWVAYNNNKHLSFIE
jgi:hypothetical protein